MRRLLLLAVAVLLFASTGAAVTSYDIALDGHEARINVTFELYAEDPVNYWRTSWRAPTGAAVLSVADSQGAIENYTYEDGILRFRTNEGPAREKEVIDVALRIDDAVTEEHRELDLVRLQLSGFSDRFPDRPDEVTQVAVTSDRDILAESHSFGFDHALEEHAVNYSGTGPVNLHLSISDAGERTEHFARFGPGDLSTADDLYWVAAAVTGFLPQVNRYPVVVYPDEEYDATVDPWSAGQYRSGGLIFVRQDQLESDRGPGLVLHEVMHGFNEQALRWSNADRAWFDEGTASYVEWLVNANRSVPTAEIFGEEVTWRDGRNRYTLPPRKTPDDLWEYYESDADYMRTWTLFDSSVDRMFGYAFSELMVRRYVQQNGPGSLRAVYRDLRALNTELDEPIADTEASNERITRIMDTSFRPCYAPEREEMERCLEAANDMRPRIPELGDVGGDVERVPLEPIERPDIQRDGGIRYGNVTRTAEEGARSLAALLRQLIGALRDALSRSL